MANMEDSLETLEAMLHQEDSGYAVPAFLSHLPQHTARGKPIDPQARSTIAEWCYKIMTVCDYTSETAEIAVSCLDRYVSTRHGYSALLDRQQFQLAALAAVYTSVKIHEPQALSPELVAKLSHNVFSRVDIEHMEMKMLKALQWRVNPATTMDFVRAYLSLIPGNVLDSNTRKLIVDLSQCQVNRSIIDYDFCTKKKSNIAFASLLNSVESIYADGFMRSYIESLLSHRLGIDESKLQNLSDRLYEAIANVPEAKLLQATQSQKATTNQTTSRWNLLKLVRPAPQSPRSVNMM